ncbi:MAG: zinc-dependent peptidase [Burkholderiales bacterium]|nr:MAG: zinc-dependent peptidase [Burkholderiales bacterium]
MQAAPDGSRLRRILLGWLPRRWRHPLPIPERLWAFTVGQLPFLQRLTASERQDLRLLCAHFLQEKEFHGAHGLRITDAMALSIAAQACLPLLHLTAPPGSTDTPRRIRALDWYDDFVGIVVQPGAALARREVTDAHGVVHRYEEALAGEAMDRGPLMLSWEEVARAGQAAASGANVVIHEFVHKIDMRGMSRSDVPDGAPALRAGFAGLSSARAAREHWRATMQDAYDSFREQVNMAERFGAEAPWLDSYAAKDPAEFFAVTCEAYFVNRDRFATEFPALLALYDAFFLSGQQSAP